MKGYKAQQNLRLGGPLLRIQSRGLSQVGPAWQVECWREDWQVRFYFRINFRMDPVPSRAVPFSIVHLCSATESVYNGYESFQNKSVEGCSLSHFFVRDIGPTSSQALFSTHKWLVDRNRKNFAQSHVKGIVKSREIAPYFQTLPKMIGERQHQK